MKTSEAFRSMIAHNCWVETDKHEIKGQVAWYAPLQQLIEL